MALPYTARVIKSGIYTNETKYAPPGPSCRFHPAIELYLHRVTGQRRTIGKRGHSRVRRGAFHALSSKSVKIAESDPYCKAQKSKIRAS